MEQRDEEVAKENRRRERKQRKKCKQMEGLDDARCSDIMDKDCTVDEVTENENRRWKKDKQKLKDRVDDVSCSDNVNGLDLEENSNDEDNKRKRKKRTENIDVNQNETEQLITREPILNTESKMRRKKMTKANRKKDKLVQNVCLDEDTDVKVSKKKHYKH